MSIRTAVLLGVVAKSSASSANPIRKVVNLIQGLQKKVEQEAVKEQKLFDEFMCYCKNGVGSLEESISGNKAKVPKVQADIESAEASVQQLKADVKQHTVDRDSAKASSAKATALREKQAAAFAKFKADSETNIAAINKAVGALEAGAGGSFLQTAGAQSLKRFVVDKAELVDVDRDTVMAFLEGGETNGYAPQSGQVTGILKQMGDTMASDLKGGIAEENASIGNFDGLIAANNKQIAAATAAIEEKSVRVSEVAVKVVNMKADLKDTEKALIEDTKFLADLKKNCGTKEAEWAETKKLRAEEVIALADTVNILNGDDALELFKKTLPGASSLLQLASGAQSARAKALELLHAADMTVKPGARRLDFIALALRGKKIGFDKVIKMCDEMVVILKKEQQDDDSKKGYCSEQFDVTDDKRKGLEQSISDSEKAIEDAQESIATLNDEISALEAGIKALDKSVDAATEQRKKENDEYKDLMASDAAARELLGVAKNRLNKFYNPSQYNPPPKRELTAEDRAAMAAGGAVLVDISAHGGDDEAPGPAPDGPSAYSKKTEESNGVIQMLDLLVQDLDKEMQVAEVDEKNAQEEYEQMLADSAAKRSDDAKAIANKKGAKADAEEALASHTDAKGVSTKELAATVEYIGSLHGECDWLLQHYDVRKEARSSEIDAIGKAKAVLSGADFSLLQTDASRSRGLRSRQQQAPEDKLAAEMTHDLEMNFNKIAPFGKEDTAKELQDHAAKTQDTLVDAVENAEVAEIKRAVFRALTRLRAATIKEFDTIARLETQAIDAYNDAHHYRAENPLAHLHEDEAPVETDKLKSFH